MQFISRSILHTNETLSGELYPKQFYLRDVSVFVFAKTQDDRYLGR